MIEALITIGSIMVYGIGGGITRELLMEKFASNDTESVLGPVAWPLILPGMIGARWVRRIRASRAQKALPVARVIS